MFSCSLYCKQYGLDLIRSVFFILQRGPIASCRGPYWYLGKPIAICDFPKGCVEGLKLFPKECPFQYCLKKLYSYVVFLISKGGGVQTSCPNSGFISLN